MALAWDVVRGTIGSGCLQDFSDSLFGNSNACCVSLSVTFYIDRYDRVGVFGYAIELKRFHPGLIDYVDLDSLTLLSITNPIDY